MNDEHPHQDKIKGIIALWAAPLLLSTIGVLGGIQLNAITSSIANLNQSQQSTIIQLGHTAVQLATIQEQIHEGQQSNQAIESQITQLQNTDQDQNHRLTVLESLEESSTGKRFREP